MKIYLAINSPDIYINELSGLGKVYNYSDINLLTSYEYINNKTIELIPKVGNFIIDSGIFTYLNGKDTSGIDWEEYAFKYADFVKKWNIKNYVEIDIDSQIGLDNVEKLRKKVEKRVGWKSMPVWHIGRGYDKWLEICRDYDYVCFGAFITDGLSKTKYHMINKFLYDAEKMNCKVHGLGFTSFVWLPKLKFYSVDSSTYVNGGRFGLAYQMDYAKKTLAIKPKPEGWIYKDNKKLAAWNFKEWMKFVKWAEHHL